ncbi:MAG: molybdopterin-dependent oxidoreductase [Rhizobiales bacterium]|nr:molybdopterin-dependent oxidoreductase [Hyphomicrobiales bacterium]
MPTTTVKGCCPLDCQDSCSWTVSVEDGHVKRVEGAKAHPITRGVLCAKVRDYEQRLTAPDRVLHPLRRVGAKGEAQFQRISWDEALDEIASRFKAIIAEHGAEALMPFHYLGSMGVVQRFALMRVFHALGASLPVGGVCAVSAGALMSEGHPIGVDPEDAVHAQFIILWGQNVLTTSHHHWHFLDEARRRGARIVTIDPRTTRTARASDQHLRIIPGSDAVLAAAMARVMIREGLADLEGARAAASDFEAYRASVMEWTLPRAAEATGLGAEEIAALAREFGRARPALIRAGIAPMQTVNGESFVRGLSALTFLGGHWRTKGGGLSILTIPGLADENAGRPDLIAGSPRSLDIAKLGPLLTDAALSPPIKGLMVWSANPAVTQIDSGLMRRGLMRDDLFTVVFDHFITDTARHADIVLPATTQFEHFDVQGAWGHYYVSANEPAIAPMGEAMSGGALMRALAARLGLDHPALGESDEEIAASALPEGWRLDDLRATGWMKLAPQATGPQLALSLAGPIEAPAPLPPQRLQLLTPKSHYFLNSTFANMPRQQRSQGLAAIEIHPDEARSRALRDGDVAMVRNGEAAMRLMVKVTDTIRPGLAVLEGKWWGGDNDGDAPMNRLTQARFSPHGQPAYNDTFVTIERMASAS